MSKSHYLRGAVIWSLASIFFLYEFFIRAFMGSVAVPFQSALMVSPAQFAMIASAYYFAYSPMQIPVGMLMDRFGARILLSTGALLCALGTLLFSHTHTFGEAWFARFLMGMGSSVGFISVLTIALNWFPKRFFGFFSGMTEILGMIGPILSGAPLAFWLAATNNDWRHILLSVALIGFALTLLLALFVRHRPQDLKTSASIVPANTMSLKKKLKALLKIKAVRNIALYSFFIYGSLPLLGETWGTPYLQAQGFSLTDATGMIAFLWLGMGFGSPLVGIISDLLRRRKLILTLCGILGFFATAGFTFINTSSALPYILLLFLVGVAGGGQTLSFAIMAESVPEAMHGSAMGFNNMAVMLGGMFSQLIAGFVLNYFWKGSGESVVDLSLHAYHLAMMLLLVFFFFAAVMGLRLKETHAKACA